MGLTENQGFDLFCSVVVEIMKFAKYTWEIVIESIIILGFLMADTSSKKRKKKTRKKKLLT